MHSARPHPEAWEVPKPRPFVTIATSSHPPCLPDSYGGVRTFCFCGLFFCNACYIDRHLFVFLPGTHEQICALGGIL